MKPSGIGGMAVMEGVMMKNKETYAVAVRKPDKEIAIEVKSHKDFSEKVKLFKLPIFRGIIAFVDSLVVGMKVLNYSASFFEEDEEKPQTDKKDKKDSAKSKQKVDDVAAVAENNQLKEEAATLDTEKDSDNTLLMAVAVLISIVMSIALFMVLPVLITNLFSSVIKSQILINVIEGLVRLAIFIGYVILASQMKEIKRVFMYHGAEHKTINCLENGLELTVKNVRKQSKQHKRCGTSFMLLVVLISLLFFMFLPSMNLFGRILSRVLLVPFIAGVSYEFIRLAGKSESKVVNVLSQPGLWMQGLTTKEPDDSMIEVAIKSVEAVFDWKAFLAEGKPASKNKTDVKKVVDNKIENKQVENKKVNPNEVENKKVDPNRVEAKKAEDRKLETKKSELNHEELSQADKRHSSTMHEDERSKEGAIGRNKGTAPVTLRRDLSSKSEEDDDILKALDKFFDEDKEK